jgi:hypothetical protein
MVKSYKEQNGKKGEIANLLMIVLRFYLFTFSPLSKFIFLIYLPYDFTRRKFNQRIRS